MSDPLNKLDDKTIEEHKRLYHLVSIVFDYQLEGGDIDYDYARANWLRLLEYEDKNALAAVLTNELDKIAYYLSAERNA